MISGIHIPPPVARRAILAITLWPIAFSGLAQGMYNSSTLHITGAEVHVDGQITNTGVVDNNGLISFTGDWTNKSIYKGEGSVEARGHAPQKVVNNNQPVARFLVNGWGTKYIDGKLIVVNELYLQEGIVHVSTHDVLKLREEAVVKGGSPASFVDGALTVEGNGYKFFPIGKHGTYAPIEFLDVKGPRAEYSMEVFENPPLVPVDEVLIKNTHYWKRKDIVGTFGSTAVAIDYDASQFTNPEEIVLVTGSDWSDTFAAIRDVEQSPETHKITTRVLVSSPIIMLGEIYERWAEADFYVPTALSPNASQVANRSVKVFGDRLTEEGFRFQVFNRWGELVYECTSLDALATNGWDGRNMRGAPLATGTYPYRLTALDKIGRKFEKKGVITIVH